nr:unnamed protein product [Callosobruchus analis]
MFGLQPFWFHVTNVLLHTGACMLFTRVCLHVAGLKTPFAALAGLLFAVHPIHTEAVTGIVGRADVLACVFFLISFLAYHGNSSGKCRIWVSVLLGGLSMLSKETGVTVFLLNLVYDFYLHWPDIRWSLSEMKWNPETMRFTNRAAKMLISLGILLALRLAILQGSLPKFSQQDNPAAFHPSLFVRVLTFCYLSAFNWWLLVCPATLSHDWQMGSIPLVTSISDSRNLVTCFFFGFAFILAARALADFESQRHPQIVLGLLFLVIPFLPATNLLVTVGFVVAERVLYIPSLGCILLVVYGLQLLCSAYHKHRQTIAFFIVLLVATASLRTIVRNRDWRSRDSLLRAGLETLPHNAKMHYNYANFLRDSKRPELAKVHYHAALRLWPSYASAHNNLGTLLNSSRAAEYHFLAAIRYSADHVNAHYNLGQLYRKLNKSGESEHMLIRCLTLEPSFTPAYIELAKLRGPSDPTIDGLLKKVVELNPTDPHFATTFGHWMFKKHNYHEALQFYWKALRISGYHQEAIISAAKALRKIGQECRLFQLITRWQLMLKIRNGEHYLSTHIYLMGWHLKSELNTKARAYDMDSYFGWRCASSPCKVENTSAEEKWKKNETSSKGKKAYTSRKNIDKVTPTTDLKLHHLVDSIL